MKLTRRILIITIITTVIYLCICLTLVFWPTPKKQNVQSYDFSSLNSTSKNESAGEEKWLTLRDQSKLFYRYYESDAKSTLILIHGSGSESRYLSNFASFLAKSGISRVITPDLRGHGRTASISMSKKKGDIDYIGQYDDDLEDLIRYTRTAYPQSKIVLGGHSSGGGLALRYAGNTNLSAVDSYLLLAPYLGHEAITIKTNEHERETTTLKPKAGEWVTVALKRWIGLAMLNNIGVSIFNYLPVLIFNLPDTLVDDLQTPDYSYRLAMSFQPHNYIEDIKQINRPTLVLVGEKDEAFNVEQFAIAFRPAQKYVYVKTITGAKHMDIFNNADAKQEINNWYTKLSSNN